MITEKLIELKSKSYKVKILNYILVLAVFASCSEPPVPKPKGYFRIEIPEQAFDSVEVDCGLAFEKSKYSKLEKVESESSGHACWFNLYYPRYNARLHCTSLELRDNLMTLMNDAQEMVFSHDKKSNGISRIRVSNKEKHLNGVLYHIGGPVATPMQFFVTDSTEHFIRGSLYFEHAPNADSTAPVVNALLADVERLMKSATWE